VTVWLFHVHDPILSGLVARRKMVDTHFADSDDSGGIAAFRVVPFGCKTVHHMFGSGKVENSLFKFEASFGLNSQTRPNNKYVSFYAIRQSCITHTIVMESRHQNAASVSLGR